ncbi:DUF1499 domain-containing protein [Marinicellulosiphila megalodicopiae]|uniref:DUF1499 domain-containing protein n=1 Tax=Marinicellulosiphila megalodicopiae TaxID=2724896 RepID=UPI003BB0864C
MKKYCLILFSFLFILLIINIIWLYHQNSKTPILGLISNKLAPMPKTPNAISSQTQVLSKKVEPLHFKGSLEHSKEALITIISNINGTELVENDEQYLYFIFSTSLMKFKDDVEFYFDDEKKIIDIRSSSRAGYSDLGKNLERYEFIKQQWEK